MNTVGKLVTLHKLKMVYVNVVPKLFKGFHEEIITK